MRVLLLLTLQLIKEFDEQQNKTRDKLLLSFSRRTLYRINLHSVETYW